MREFKVTKDMFLNEGARVIVQKMKAAGFRFEGEGCPFVLAGHKEIVTTDDAIIYRQWEN